MYSILNLIISFIFIKISKEQNNEGMGINMRGTDTLQQYLYIEYRRTYDLLSQLKRYKFSKDKLLKPVKDIGLDNIQKDIKILMRSQVKLTEVKQFSKDLLKDAKIEYKNFTFIKEAIQETEYVTYFSGVYTSEKTNDTSFIGLVITKASTNDDVVNFIIVHFKINFILCTKDYANEQYIAYTRSKGFGIPKKEEKYIVSKEKSGIKLKKSQEKFLHKIVKHFVLQKCQMIYPKPVGDL